MAWFRNSLSVVLIALSLFHFMEVSFAQNVLELTDTNFDSVAQGTKPVLVDFYAPW